VNILPLVSAFILIFAICSYTFVHNVRTAIEEKIHYNASNRISRKFADNQAKLTYAKQKGKDLHPKNKRQAQEQKKETKYTSPRDWQNKRPESKFAIRALLKSENSPRLEKIAMILLQDLYYFAPFYRQGLEKEILITLLDTLKKHENLTDFTSLLSKIPEDKIPLFYKLIKGTHQYKLHTNIGYPALGDFISLETLKDHDPPIRFCHASRPLLEAILGPTITPLLINEEKHKWQAEHKHQPLNKQELEAFLLSHRLNPADYHPYFSYSTAKHTCPLDILHDTKTHLQIKIER
jgi:hypothetical protein